MKDPGLFSSEELRGLQPPSLTQPQRLTLALKIIDDAEKTIRYMYELDEVCLMLRKTKDEMQTLIHMYRLDCISIRSAIRIPWWSVAEFLIDEADDLDKQFYKWVDSLPRKNNYGG